MDRDIWRAVCWRFFVRLPLKEGEGLGEGVRRTRYKSR
jgi:hypothetical protein